MKPDDSDDGEFLPYATLCWHCGGTGIDDPTFDGWDDDGYIPCEHCGGSGLLYFDTDEIDGAPECPFCHDLGGDLLNDRASRCPLCGGA